LKKLKFCSKSKIKSNQTLLDANQYGIVIVLIEIR